ncbi:hypothetical protein BH09PSE3_BH09PSE3_20120 [soil metagenome]
MKPFLKWAGGKRWLFNSQFVEHLPNYKRYLEPFLGGAAGFFRLNPTSAVLSDVNPELINLYTQVRDHPLCIQAGMADLHGRHSAELFYEMRADIPTSPLDQAIRMLYLNRTCWNGLYRLNLSGKFNVPIGTKDQVVLDTDDFNQASARLKNASLLNADFEIVMNMAGEDDLVFVDPPYTVKHNMNGFVKYNESIFTWADQVRLRDAAARAAKRGASFDRPPPSGPC